MKWRKCPTCGRYTSVNDEGVCGGDPTSRNETEAPIEGCGQPHPPSYESDNSKLHVRGGPTPKFYPN
jgi:hypothetical protein